MSNKKSLFLALAMVTMIAAPMAHAGTMSFGLNGGVAVPMGDFGKVSKLGFGGGVRLRRIPGFHAGGRQAFERGKRTWRLPQRGHGRIGACTGRRIQRRQRQVRPPPYPFPVDAGKVAQGKPLFEAQCAACHAPDRDNRLGTVIPIAEIGTDRSRLDTWTKAAADGANQQVASLGITRTPMIKTQGFIAVQLDGLWLRGPFLHNGSVPTVRDLLAPPAARPRTFYRGYDLLDAKDLGFVSNVAEVRGHKFFPFDTATPGNGNGGHDYGTALSAAEKDALLEYLKTL